MMKQVYLILAALMLAQVGYFHESGKTIAY